MLLFDDMLYLLMTHLGQCPAQFVLRQLQVLVTEALLKYTIIVFFNLLDLRVEQISCALRQVVRHCLWFLSVLIYGITVNLHVSQLLERFRLQFTSLELVCEVEVIRIH